MEEISLNKAILTGNLTKDPDLRTTASGLSVCTLSVAVQRRYGNQQGERKADFFNVICWRGLADTCAKYTRKGSKVGIVGEIQNRTYEAKDGTKRYITEILAEQVDFLSNPNRPEVEPIGDIIDDDELPF